MNEVRKAVESILLGESLKNLRRAFLMRALGAEDEKALEEAMAGQDEDQAEDLSDRARTFLGRVCREMSERHPGDPRVLAALLDWVGSNKEYEAFDALLSHFRFPGRERYLEEGRGSFPRSLTAHWED